MARSASNRQELNRPAADDDVFAFDRAAPRLEIIKNGLRADEQAPRLGSESHEDDHVEGGDRFKVEGRAHRAADGVAINHAVGLHLIDGGDDFSNVHARLYLA